jgi:hypothetical protein
LDRRAANSVNLKLDEEPRIYEFNHLNHAARWTNSFKELSVSASIVLPFAHVGYEEASTDDVLHREAAAGEDSFDSAEDRLGLLVSISWSAYLSLVIHGGGSGYEEMVSYLNGSRIATEWLKR